MIGSLTQTSWTGSMIGSLTQTSRTGSISHTNIKDLVHETALSHKRQQTGSRDGSLTQTSADWVHETALSHKHEQIGSIILVSQALAYNRADVGRLLRTMTL